ncbi:MAG TPA: DUF2911 domain-containing protein [Chitinophagaceae bacterium]|nr:DUF2911 domain-containing protein [Chitinophagaceae bacterium]
MHFFKAFLLIQFTSVILIACADSGSGSKNDADIDNNAAKTDTSKKSIPSQVSKEIGNAELAIKYHSPAVRGRIIWGGLVPYDNVWVTGAHKATSIEVSNDFMVGEQRIPDGKYAIFTIPSKDEWTVIINKNWDQHLADEYTEIDDVVRIKVKPVALADTVERLRYDIEQSGERLANVRISWEKLQVAFSIQIVD